MAPHLTGEPHPGRRASAGAWLRSRTLLQWVLAAMVAVGLLAFIRAFAGGEALAAERLAWGDLSWTFPLLWDLTAVIGSTLWIAAPRRTAAFRWGVFLNLTAAAVSAVGTGSQAYTTARDALPGGWPIPAFIAGAAVPVLYSILTWAAASARDALTDRSGPWTATEEGREAGTPHRPTPAAAQSSSPDPLTTPTRPSLSGGPAPWPSPTAASSTSPGSDTTPTALPLVSSSDTRLADAATRAAGGESSPEPTPESPTTSSGAGTPTDPPTHPIPAADTGAPTPSTPSTPTPPPSGGPKDPPAGSSLGLPVDSSAGTPEQRREWAVAELYRRAETDGGSPLRARDIDREFGTKDGWRVLRDAQQRYDAERALPAGVER